ncbi:MAG: helix-turn-helix transcriptional regulator [Actinomycetia bacterium]|nr:helix-turn-helix transcriptional regulator [Actinomycetes bacterium]MCP4960532.1 helix-turn-helix transcriptional regulator [Actinomycetes bacterium]
MRFGDRLRKERERLGLTQADVAQTTGIARPNIAAYEADRREPRLSTAEQLLAAVGSRLEYSSRVSWTWTEGMRPYAVPSRLWRLPIHQALETITTSDHLWWSGPNRTFDLSDLNHRHRAYEIVLREGTPADIEAIVDGLLVVLAWPHLVLPAQLRAAWDPIVCPDLDRPAAGAA